MPVTPRHVLAVRLSSLGDTLLTFPALDALKAAHPDARITLVTGQRFATLPLGCAAVDEVIALDQAGLGRWRRSAWAGLGGLLRRATTGEFDCAIDFHGYSETAALMFATAAPVRIGQPMKTSSLWYTFTPDRKSGPGRWYERHVNLLRLAGVIPPEAPTPPLRLVPDDDARQEAADWIREAGIPTGGPDGDGVLAIFPGASNDEKRWPADRFAALAVDTATRGRATGLVIFTGPRELDLAGEIRQLVEAADANCPVWIAPPFLPVPFVAAVQQVAPVAFVANDTGPMHLAVASGACRVVALFDFHRRGFEHPEPHVMLVAPDRAITSITVDQVLASLGWTG